LRKKNPMIKMAAPTHFPMHKRLIPLALAAALTPLASADDAATAKLMEVGKTSYMMCAACHGMDAKGVPAGPTLMAPSLVDSKVALGNPSVFALILLHGIQKEGNEYLGMMAPLGAALSDEQLAGVMTYVRGSFGNKAAAVSVEDAKKYREEWKDITAPVTRAKIAELSAK
jgi:mono/diheme cytochrome c family protein